MHFVLTKKGCHIEHDTKTSISGHCIKQKIKVYNTFHIKGIHFAGMMSNKESKKDNFVIKASIWGAFFHPTKMNLSQCGAEQKRCAIWATARSFPPEEIQMGS
jgi:hypothetical protein